MLATTEPRHFLKRNGESEIKSMVKQCSEAVLVPPADAQSRSTISCRSYRHAINDFCCRGGRVGREKAYDFSGGFSDVAGGVTMGAAAGAAGVVGAAAAAAAFFFAAAAAASANFASTSAASVGQMRW